MWLLILSRPCTYGELLAVKEFNYFVIILNIYVLSVPLSSFAQKFWGALSYGSSKKLLKPQIQPNIRELQARTREMELIPSCRREVLWLFSILWDGHVKYTISSKYKSNYLIGKKLTSFIWSDRVFRWPHVKATNLLACKISFHNLRAIGGHFI